MIPPPICILFMRLRFGKTPHLPFPDPLTITPCPLLRQNARLGVGYGQTFPIRLTWRLRRDVYDGIALKKEPQNCGENTWAAILLYVYQISCSYTFCAWLWNSVKSTFKFRDALSRIVLSESRNICFLTKMLSQITPMSLLRALLLDLPIHLLDDVLDHSSIRHVLNEWKTGYNMRSQSFLGWLDETTWRSTLQVCDVPNFNCSFRNGTNLHFCRGGEFLRI